MKREIKFRVWDTPNGGLTGKWFWPTEKYGHALDYAVEFNMPVEQYTGLKDKNGKEIYEGDICKINKTDYNVQVLYFQPYAGFMFEAEGILYDMNEGPEYIEIIGNIHENPELL